MKLKVFSIAMFFLSFTTLADIWPGTGGKLCFDTPRPARYSDQDYQMEIDRHNPNDSRTLEVKIKSLESRPLKFNGDLVVEIDEKPAIDLPKEKGIFIDRLDPEQKHTIKIKTKSGKLQQSFKFRFENPRDPRARISQGSIYHIDMQVNPAGKKCPWP